MDPLSLALTFGPIIAKGVMGLLPANATSVIGKVVDMAKRGLSIAKPVVGVLSNITGNDDAGAGADISLAEMHAAIAELDTPGTYEDALARAEAELRGAAS